MKNRGMDRRHPLPGGRGVFFFLERDKEIKERGRNGQRGLNVRENNKRRRHRERERDTEGLIDGEREAGME